MRDTFITQIHIEKVRHLTNVDIELSETELKHLILTGKNGSGKTSLLEMIKSLISQQQLIDASQPFNKDLSNQRKRTFYYPSPQSANRSISITLTFPENNYGTHTVVFVYLASKRSELSLPKAIESVNIPNRAGIKTSASKNFLNYILNLYVQYLSAKDSNNPSYEIDRYQSWFNRFTQALREIYDCPELELVPDMRNLKFNITMPGRESFGLNEMSDGYKAFIEIMMELLMRFEFGGGIVNYDEPAIVLIDEIETHLHVEMQKLALPFLTRMFPSVQFIVSTHSPFVITSIPDAVIYDLEKHERLENPSRYSYEAVVESFLDTNMYSEEMKRYFERYKELCFKERTVEENEEFLRAKTELELIPPASKELYIAFRELEEKRKGGKEWLKLINARRLPSP